MGAKAREMVVVVLHLAFWSQLGVVTRILFGLAVPGRLHRQLWRVPDLLWCANSALWLPVCTEERSPSPRNMLALLHSCGNLREHAKLRERS